MAKLGLTDSQRIVMHSLKVGLALTLASLLVLLKHPYYWIGQNAIWAVITVVVVFETSAGETLSKGLNRGLGTVLAGLLALGVAHLADLLQVTGEPIFIGAMVFISGSLCTCIRAIPTVKKKFDYGVMIFMLTFSLVLVTGYRTGDEVRRAIDRLLTILIGGLISLAVSSFLFPHWAGEDLHKQTADHFDELGNALEECVKVYLRGEAQPFTGEMIADDADPVYNKCREAVQTRNTEEALVVFASWEPPHGRFRLGFPWKQYLKVGAMLRHCAYSVLALHGCLRSEIQPPSALRTIFANEMLTASRDAANVLHELSACIRNMHKPKGSSKDLLQKTFRAAEAIKESMSKHSDLLATPESWRTLEGSLNDIIGVSKSQHFNETVKVKGTLAASNFTQPKEVALDQIGGYQATERVQNYGKEDNSRLKTVGYLHSEEEEKNASLSFPVPKLQTLLGHDAFLTPPVKREPASSSPDWTPHIASNVQSTEKACDKIRVESIAGAASLISFTSILVETLARLDHLVEAVQTLSKFGRFGSQRSNCASSRVHVQEHCIDVRIDQDCQPVCSRREKSPRIETAKSSSLAAME